MECIILVYIGNLGAENSGAFVRPGDLILGDDDGVVVIPPKTVEAVIAYSHNRELKEKFERGKLLETGDIG